MSQVLYWSLLLNPFCFLWNTIFAFYYTPPQCDFSILGLLLRSHLKKHHITLRWWYQKTSQGKIWVSFAIDIARSACWASHLTNTNKPEMVISENITKRDLSVLRSWCCLLRLLRPPFNITPSHTEMAIWGGYGQEDRFKYMSPLHNIVSLMRLFCTRHL